MPKATSIGGSGPLNAIKDCYIIIPVNVKPPEDGRNSPTFIFEDKQVTIVLDNLPEISDTKSANYADETIIGRSNPIKTYSQSDNRSISMQLHFIVSAPYHVRENLAKLRAIQSAVYPRESEGGSPFIPPPVCRIKCGNLLGTKEVCVILKSYSVKFPTDVAWDSENSSTFTPYKFDVDTTWDVVYSSSSLPGQDIIFQAGV